MDAATDQAAGDAGIRDRPPGRKLVPQGVPAPVRRRRRWDWLVSGLIVIGGLLCGWAVPLAFNYICTRWFGVNPYDWYPWWAIGEITCGHLVVIGGALAAARYWFRYAYWNPGRDADQCADARADGNPDADVDSPAHSDSDAQRNA